MKIENGLNPNCSEYVLKIYSKLTKEQVKDIKSLLISFIPELELHDMKDYPDEVHEQEDKEKYSHRIVNRERSDNMFYTELDRVGDYLTEKGISNSGSQFQG